MYKLSNVNNAMKQIHSFIPVLKYTHISGSGDDRIRNHV